MHQRNRADDGQPQPVVHVAANARRVDAVEAFKQPAQVLGGDGFALVGDGDDGKSPLLLQQYRNGAARDGVARTVFKQVSQRAMEQPPVNLRPHFSGNLNGQIVFHKRRFDVFRRFQSFFPQRHFAQLGSVLSGLSVGQEQHVVDDRGHAFQLFQVRLQQFFQFLYAAFASQRQLGLTNQIGERGAQLMRHVGVKALQLPPGHFLARQHAIERLRQVAQFGR